MARQFDPRGCASCGSAPQNGPFCSNCGARLAAQSSRPVKEDAGGKGQIGWTTAQTSMAIVALVLTVGIVLLGAFALDRPAQSAAGGVPQTAAPTVDPYVVVTYKLDGSARSADLTYTDGSGNIQQQTGKAVPLRRTADGGEGIQFQVRHGTFVTFSAQNQGETGDLTCLIEADGEIINRGHADGGYAIVSCSASVP